MTLTSPSDAAAPWRSLPDVVSLAPEHIYRPRFTSVADVIETVDAWGVIAFPGFVQGETLAALNREFDALIGARRDLGVQVDEVGSMVNLRIPRAGIPAGTLPATAGFFGGPQMQEIATAYFRGEAFQLNRELYVNVMTTTTVPQNKPPFALHFDKIRLFKFFLYLTDTDAENGATRVAPGSQKIIGPWRRRQLAERPINDIPNVVPEPETPSMPVSGPAGTLFIFDTDMAHGASSVLPGRTRRVMRGDCWGAAMLKAVGFAA